MAQQTKKRGPKPWVVKRTEVLHSEVSEAHMKNWQSFCGEQEAGMALRRLLAIANRLRSTEPRMLRRALEETKP